MASRSFTLITGVCIVSIAATLVTAQPPAAPATASAAADATDPQAADRSAVKRAVLDYAEAYYERKREYFERSVHDELFKVGYTRGDDGAYRERPLTKAQLVGMVDRMIEGGHTPSPGPKDVEILQLGKNIALAKLTGSWGIDYMQLTNEDARWQTRHVVWQSDPEDRKASDDDRAAINAALAGYVAAFYENKPETVDGFISPRLSKIGFMRRGDELRELTMTLDQLRDLASRIDLPDDAPSSYEILDIMDMTACARIEALWGVDYVHLAKVDGTWEILQIVWEGR